MEPACDKKPHAAEFDAPREAGRRYDSTAMTLKSANDLRLRRDADDPFATGHAREALNFNLSVIIYAVAAGVLSVVTLGLALLVVVPAAAIAFIAYLVVSVQATLAASRGATYRYPLTMRLVGESR